MKIKMSEMYSLFRFRHHLIQAFNQKFEHNQKFWIWRIIQYPMSLIYNKLTTRTSKCGTCAILVKAGTESMHDTPMSHKQHGSYAKEIWLLSHTDCFFFVWFDFFSFFCLKLLTKETISINNEKPENCTKKFSVE